MEILAISPRNAREMMPDAWLGPGAGQKVLLRNARNVRKRPISAVRCAKIFIMRDFPKRGSSSGFSDIRLTWDDALPSILTTGTPLGEIVHLNKKCASKSRKCPISSKIAKNEQVFRAHDGRCPSEVAENSADGALAVQKHAWRYDLCPGARPRRLFPRTGRSRFRPSAGRRTSCACGAPG